MTGRPDLFVIAIGDASIAIDDVRYRLPVDGAELPPDQLKRAAAHLRRIALRTVRIAEDIDRMRKAR